MKKWGIIILIMFLLTILVNAETPICEDRIKSETPCSMITPVLTSCSINNYTVYNATSGSIVEEDTLILLNDSVYYFTFNHTEGEYVVQLCDESTRRIRVTNTIEGIFEGKLMEIAILMFLGILVIVGGIATMTTKSYSRFVFLLLTGLIIVVTLNISARFAEDTAVSAGVTRVLWTLYTVSLWLYVFLFFSVLVIFLLYLRVRNNVPPDMGSPLQDSPYMKR